MDSKNENLGACVIQEQGDLGLGVNPIDEKYLEESYKDSDDKNELV